MKKLIAIVSGILLAMGSFVGCKKAATVPADQPVGGQPDWVKNAVIYEVNTRQYTPEGTFNAMAGHLPRLKELGVDVLWFMPIHPISEKNRKGELGSYYAAADFKAVNPEFGTFDDFRALVDSAHALGMKVIIDWVPNHTGCDNAWVTEHPEYYALNDSGQMFGPYDWTDVYKLDYSKPETRKAMTDIMAFWLNEAGIDGFRCDAAALVPVDYWNDTRKELEQAAGRPIFMLAEAQEPELVEEAFDADYNWPMKELFNEIAYTSGQYTFGNGEKTFPEKHAADIYALLAHQDTTYRAGSFMMNMTSNHDLNSWEGTEFERLGNLSGALAAISYTLPGMPLIYTGQETGMNRALEFFVKDTPPQWEPTNDYFTFYQRLNAMKHSRPELAVGADAAKVVEIPTGNPDVIVYARTAGNSTTLTGANLGKEEAKLAIELPFSLDGATDVVKAAPAVLPEALAPGEFFVFTVNN
ncbi:MAG: alpha-amylase [Bacteroidales bacterium]|nr:alpha-amylase [Bacteroidales bacterium]